MPVALRVYDVTSLIHSVKMNHEDNAKMDESTLRRLSATCVQQPHCEREGLAPPVVPNFHMSKIHSLCDSCRLLLPIFIKRVF